MKLYIVVVAFACKIGFAIMPLELGFGVFILTSELFLRSRVAEF